MQLSEELLAEHLSVFQASEAWEEDRAVRLQGSLGAWVVNTHMVLRLASRDAEVDLNWLTNLALTFTWTRELGRCTRSHRLLDHIVKVGEQSWAK